MPQVVLHLFIVFFFSRTDYSMEGLVHSQINPIPATCRRYRSRFVPALSLQLKNNVISGGILLMKSPHYCNSITASAQPLKASSLSHFNNTLPSKGHNS